MKYFATFLASTSCIPLTTYTIPIENSILYFDPTSTLPFKVQQPNVTKCFPLTDMEEYIITDSNMQLLSKAVLEEDDDGEFKMEQVMEDNDDDNGSCIYTQDVTTCFAVGMIGYAYGSDDKIYGLSHVSSFVDVVAYFGIDFYSLMSERGLNRVQILMAGGIHRPSINAEVQEYMNGLISGFKDVVVEVGFHVGQHPFMEGTSIDDYYLPALGMLVGIDGFQLYYQENIVPSDEQLESMRMAME